MLISTAPRMYRGVLEARFRLAAAGSTSIELITSRPIHGMLTVTTSAAIDFMRKPGPGALAAEARILKLGRTLAVGDVLVFSDGTDAPVARASLTRRPGRRR